MYAGPSKGRLKGYILHQLHPLKSFCEVGYANFRTNVFAAGKRISVEILVGVGMHE